MLVNEGQAGCEGVKTPGWETLEVNRLKVRDQPEQARRKQMVWF